MAERDRASFLALIYLVCLVAQAVSNPVNIPLGRVPPRLLGKAWRALNEHSPTHHLYAHGNLINAQELEEPPYKVYKFTYDLSPICGTESCPREACTIDLKQDEHGDIETLNDSIQCMYFYPADAQNDMSQEQQSYQEQEDSQVTQENLAEQVNNNRSVELDHEIQETGDENVRTFVAVRANNYCPGCPYELNPNLPGLLPFVEQALKLMDEQTANDYKHKLMSIVRVTRSVPVSSNVIEYQLLLQIGESECLKNALEQEQECPLRTTVPTKLCLVTFEQRPWQQTSLRVVKNNCTDPENTSSANSQTQRSLESESLVTVKYDEGRFATEKFAAYEGLKEMLDNYTHAPSVPSKEPEEVAMTESAIVKIVLNKSQDDEETLGFMNKTKDYREFLEDFDLPVEDATVETAGPLKEVKEDKFQRKKVEDFKLEKANNKEDVNRKKRSQRLFGAPEPIPVDHPDIQLYVNKTLQKISAESNEPNEPFIEIIEASVQVVSGQLYKIKAKLGTSDCPKGTISNCQLQAGSEMKECLIKIWSQPWVDKGSPEITVECPSSENNRKKRSPPLVGAPATIPVDHPDVQLYVNKAQQKISAESNEPNEPYIEIIEASVQVVAGQLYKIKAKLGTSDCPKGTTSNCQLQAGSEMKECLIKVWSRPWLDNGSPEITVECSSSENKRKKRSQPGAPETIPIDHPDVQLYVNKAQEKFSAESNEPNEPYIEIIEASVQVVTGRLYKIKTKLGTSDCPKGTTSNCQLQAGSEMKECLIKVWSRPWLDHGSPEITTECSSSENKRKKRSLRGTNYNNNMMRIAEDMKIERLFNVFVETYNRTYSTADEKNLRLQIFRENLGIIDLLQRNEQGTARYGVNMFADVSREEFRQRYLGLRPDLQSENEIPLPQAEIPDVDLPPTFDWRKKNVVTSVKDQGSCGSCWAFSVTGNVEGQYAIKHGQLLSLSEQELVDCDDLDDGCSGGLPDNAYRAIEKLGGLELETDYPYEAENEKCHFKRNLARVQLASAVNITSNETQMAQWLVQNGPISIGINANAMQFYMGGVSHPFKFLCNPNNLDHGVLIVGYGTSSYPLFHRKLPYWIVKNSWGKSWGEQGYYRVYRGDGTCGLNMMASSAVVV